MKSTIDEFLFFYLTAFRVFLESTGLDRTAFKVLGLVEVHFRRGNDLCCSQYTLVVGEVFCCSVYSYNLEAAGISVLRISDLYTKDHKTGSGSFDVSKESRNISSDDLIYPDSFEAWSNFISSVGVEEQSHH